MASPLTNTFTRYDGKGLREFLNDVISDISPMDTPVLNMATEESVNQTLFEWQTDALRAAITNNQKKEGFDQEDEGFDATTATVRLGNYTQISSENFIVSGTLEVVNKAGRDSEVAYQIPRRAREIRRDQETHMCGNIGGAAGSSSVARVSASLLAFIKTNVNKEAGGGNPTYTSGVPGAARTDGTPRALTETTIFQDVAEQMWTSGAEVDGSTVIVGPVNKGKISAFAGIAAHRVSIPDSSRSPSVSVAAIDVYITDFGALQIVPNRFSRERDALFLDPDHIGLGVLRPYMVEELAKSGDAIKYMMLVEYGVKVTNEKGLGLAADLTTT